MLLLLAFIKRYFYLLFWFTNFYISLTFTYLIEDHLRSKSVSCCMWIMCESILALSMQTVAIIAGQLDRVPHLILSPRPRCSFLQPGHVHVLDGSRKIREVLANKKKWHFTIVSNAYYRTTHRKFLLSPFLAPSENQNKKWTLLNEFNQCNASIIGASLSLRFTFFSKQYQMFWRIIIYVAQMRFKNYLIKYDIFFNRGIFCFLPRSSHVNKRGKNE